MRDRMVGRYPIFQFTNNGVIQLYIAREGSGKFSDPDPDPAKRSGSDRIRIRNPVYRYRRYRTDQRRTGTDNYRYR